MHPRLSGARIDQGARELRESAKHFPYRHDMHDMHDMHVMHSRSMGARPAGHAAFICARTTLSTNASLSSTGVLSLNGYESGMPMLRFRLLST